MPEAASQHPLHRSRVSLVATILVSTSACATADDSPRDAAEQGIEFEREYLPRTARVHHDFVRAADPTPWDEPAMQARPIAENFLIEKGSDPALVADLRLVSQSAGSSGVVHTRLEQRVDGLRVYEAHVRTAVRGGELVSVIENVVREETGMTSAQIDPEIALAAALGELYPFDDTPHASVEHRADGVDVFDAGDLLAPPTVESVWIPTLGGVLEQGYVVQLWGRDNALHHVLIGGDGRVMNVQNRTAADSYRVYPFGKHPGNASTEVVAGPGDGNETFPLGRLTKLAGGSFSTTGNNVVAGLDVDNDNAHDEQGAPVSSDAAFDFAHNPGADPREGDNVYAAVVNAFYVVNEVHDRLYQHGFTEKAGNFQTDNFGRGGAGSDAIVLDIQDGADNGAANNANFATPPDGQRPRMQMYVFDWTDPRRDSSFDADILIHEVGHGVSWRLTGDMDNRYPLTGAVGEGYADALAVLMTGDPVIAEWSTGNPDGLRRERYDNFKGSYGEIGKGELQVHNDGEVIGAAFWHLRSQWLDRGLPIGTLMDIAIEGLMFTPARPTHEQLRDGLLDATLDADQQCMIWEAFAAYGMGVDAHGVQGCSFFSCSASTTESFDVPVACGGSGTEDNDDEGPADDGVDDNGDNGDNVPADDGPADDGNDDDGNDDDGDGNDEPGACDEELKMCEELSLPPIACAALYPDCF